MGCLHSASYLEISAKQTTMVTAADYRRLSLHKEIKITSVHIYGVGAVTVRRVSKSDHTTVSSISIEEIYSNMFTLQYLDNDTWMGISVFHHLGLMTRSHKMITANG